MHARIQPNGMASSSSVTDAPEAAKTPSRRFSLAKNAVAFRKRLSTSDLEADDASSTPPKRTSFARRESTATGGTGRKQSVMMMVMPSMPKGGRINNQRKSIALAGVVDEAGLASELAIARATEAAKAAHRANSVQQRQAWEKRVMRFLADGNAVLNNGTPMRTWVAVQDELELAGTEGVPLTNTARRAFLEMGTAAHAIKAAGESAKLAAEAAAKEWAGTKAGRRAAEAALSPTEKAAAMMLRLTEEARAAREEAAEKIRACEDAVEELRAAKHNERHSRWGVFATLWENGGCCRKAPPRVAAPTHAPVAARTVSTSSSTADTSDATTAASPQTPPQTPLALPPAPSTAAPTSSTAPPGRLPPITSPPSVVAAGSSSDDAPPSLLPRSPTGVLKAQAGLFSAEDPLTKAPTHHTLTLASVKETAHAEGSGHDGVAAATTS